MKKSCLTLSILLFLLLPALFSCTQEASPPPETADASSEDVQVPSWLESLIPDSLQEVGFLLQHWQWLALLVLALLGVIVDKVVAYGVQLAVARQLAKRIKHVDHPELHRAMRPVGWLAATLVWWPGVHWLGLPEQVLDILVTAINVIAASAVVWAIYRMVDVVSTVLEARAAQTANKFDDLLVPLVRKSLKVFVGAFGLVFIADNLKLPISSLLAGVGIGGLAVALAAQDAVKNFFGSLTVIIDRPFQVGDWVVVGSVEGTVTEVGFRSTRILTFYNSVITLPNSNLISASVDNLGARRYRRWSTKIGLACNTPPDTIEAFCEGVRELIRRHPYTRKDYFHVYFNEFSADAWLVMLYVFFETPDWATELRERHRLGLDILRLASELGVELSYPTQTLFLHRPEAAAEPLPTEGYGQRVEGVYEDARKLARKLVDGALEGKIPPPV
ncbi:MAG: mechanosensitive ion channel [bacterium]|nr:mechanosensitive ion channel [bacterium]